MIAFVAYIFALILAFKAGLRAIDGRWAEAGPYGLACLLAVLLAFVASKTVDG